MFNTMCLVATAGKSAANNRRRHKTGWGGDVLLDRLLFLRLRLGNIFNLFLHGGKQVELSGRKFRSCRGFLCRRRFHRRRNGGLSARRLFILWIYL